jgi:hypothetical protein
MLTKEMRITAGRVVHVPNASKDYKQIPGNPFNRSAEDR